MTVQSHNKLEELSANSSLSDTGLLNQLKELKNLRSLEIKNNQFTKLDDFGIFPSVADIAG